MARVETRAQALGVKVGPMLRMTRQKLRRARVLLAEVSAAWAEVDGVMSEECEEIITALDRALDVALPETKAQLAEPWGRDF